MIIKLNNGIYCNPFISEYCFDIFINNIYFISAFCLFLNKTLYHYIILINCHFITQITGVYTRFKPFLTKDKGILKRLMKV